jgi:hypothetical protein
MHLKIHTTLPCSEFNLNSRLNLFPFPAILNKLFRRAINIQIETSPALTLAQVRELHLFEQGWLPDILPPSTHNLELVKSPQINFAQGEFYFSPGDWPDFSAKLEPEKTLEKTMDAPFVNWAKSLRKMQREGHTLWHFSAHGRHWMFFCKAEEGYCEYVMWMSQEATK